jgi:hypothetical protein
MNGTATRLHTNIWTARNDGRNGRMLSDWAIALSIVNPAPAHGVYQPLGNVSIGGYPPPMIDGHSRRDVELDCHFVGLFVEHLEETLIHKLVDHGWYGVALADLAHGSVSRPDGKQSVNANGGGRTDSVRTYTARRRRGASAMRSMGIILRGREVPRSPKLYRRFSARGAAWTDLAINGAAPVAGSSAARALQSF